VTSAKDRLLRILFVQFDRLTAYGAAVRDLPYDKEACERAWDAYKEEWNNPEGFDFHVPKGEQHDR